MRTAYQKKRAGKRTYRRKGARRTKKTNALRNKTQVNAGKGFPKRMMMTHKYQAAGVYQVTSNTFSKYQFSCNGMYDPDITGVGHQPLFFDQMAAIYDQYTVIGSKLVVEVTPVTAQTSASLIGLYKDDDTVTSNTTEASMVGEQPSGYFKQLALNAVKPIRLVSKWSAKKTFGPGAVVGDLRYQGTATANPTEQTYWTLGIQNLNLTTTQNYLVSYKIEYVSVWTELKDIAQS